MKRATDLLFKKRAQYGFTLIELLVVIGIIGILIGIGVSNYLAYLSKGVDAAAQTAAADFLTLALAKTATEGAQTNLDPTQTDADQDDYVPGFHLPENIDVKGTISIAASGVITGTVQFQNTSDGENAYQIDPTGTVTRVDMFAVSP